MEVLHAVFHGALVGAHLVVAALQQGLAARVHAQGDFVVFHTGFHVGGLLGFGLGALALRGFTVRYAGLRAALLRFVPGFAVFAVFWLGTGALLKPAPESVQLAAEALRGLLAGLWFTLGWPWVLRRHFKA